jgi:hypothetical protein
MQMSLQASAGPAMTKLRDTVSHFMLRLGFCQTEDNRRWLLAQEVELFRHRYGALQGPEKVLLSSGAVSLSGSRTPSQENF